MIKSIFVFIAVLFCVPSFAQQGSYYNLPKEKTYLIVNNTGADIDVWSSIMKMNHQNIAVVVGRNHYTVAHGYNRAFTYEFADIRETSTYGCKSDFRGDVLCSNGEHHPPLTVIITKRGMCSVKERTGEPGVIQCGSSDFLR